MMFHFPYFGMPYYGRYSRYGYKYPYYTYNDNSFNYSNKNKYKCDNKKNTSSSDVSNNNECVKCNDSCNKNSNLNKDEPCFSLFGINLYFDDILLVCLIWFLYDEGVKDEVLFIALILLLLS